MALPEDDRPGMHPRERAGGNRPLSTDPTYPGAPGAGGVFSNRPILLKPRSSSDFPDADDEEDLDEEVDTDLREILRNAPAWLVSTVFHMLLLIVLGLLAFSVRTRSNDLQVEVTYAPSLGEQMDDASVLESEALELENLPEQVITPPDLTPVDDPLAAPPELTPIDLAMRPNTPSFATNVQPAEIGLALKGREAGTRSALLQRYGGTADTEAAVEAGLAWLARQQQQDGGWSLIGPFTGTAGGENQPAATAMALLAFLGHGETHLAGKYKTVVARGWDALRNMQRADGLFTGRIDFETQMMYTHAQCTIVACELYGMTSDPAVRKVAEKAIAFAVQSQSKAEGGWRYRPRLDSDTSVTGWYVMALQSAKMSKIPVPADVLSRVSEFLDNVETDDGRRYFYRPGEGSTNAVTAEAFLCRQYLGWKQDDQRLLDGIGSLVDSARIAYDGGENHDVYYWYYATQAAHHMEGTIWDEWNNHMRQIVPEHQVKKGPEAGSWDPDSDKWASWNGRLYMTCLSIYMLEVYYRHLPIYSGYQFVEGVGKTMNPDTQTESTAGDIAPAGTETGKEESQTGGSADKPVEAEIDPNNDIDPKKNRR